MKAQTFSGLFRACTFPQTCTWVCKFHRCLNSMGVFICPDFPKNLSRLFLSGFKWYIVSTISFVQAFVGFHFSLQCFPAMSTTLPDRVPSLEKLTLMPGVSRLGCLQAGQKRHIHVKAEEVLLCSLWNQRSGFCSGNMAFQLSKAATTPRRVCTWQGQVKCHEASQHLQISFFVSQCSLGCCQD